MPTSNHHFLVVEEKQSTNCLSVPDHFVGLALKGLKSQIDLSFQMTTDLKIKKYTTISHKIFWDVVKTIHISTQHWNWGRVGLVSEFLWLIEDKASIVIWLKVTNYLTIQECYEK